MDTAFDTLAYAKKLKAVGVPDEVAEVQAEALAEIVEERLTTKRDLKELEERLINRINELEYKITIRLGAMLAVVIAAVSALVKLLQIEFVGICFSCMNQNAKFSWIYGAWRMARFNQFIDLITKLP